MAISFRDLKACLPPSFEGAVPRTYQTLAASAMPYLLVRRYGPQAPEAATTIQRMWRRWGRRRVRTLRGPLVFARSQAANEEDPWTLTPVRDIPLVRFWSYACPVSGCSYALDVLAAYRWFCEEGQDNPFDRRPLPHALQDHLRRCYEATLMVPRVRALVQRERGAPKHTVTDEVFLALERSYGLVFCVDTLRQAFLSMPLGSLFAFYQDLRWWVLHYGPKHASASTWLHQDAKPRHRTISAARQFVMYGFWRLYRAVTPSDRGVLMLTLGHVLQRHAH